MNGDPINELNRGLQAFQLDIQQDGLASRRVEVAIITFGNGGVQVLQDFVEAGKFHAPVLTVGDETPMGAAINLALDKLRARKDLYQANDTPYFRPWIFLITDGQPTDSWETAKNRVHAEEKAKGVAFFAVGVTGADMKVLSQITVPTRPPRRLQGLKFVELFQWLSRSQKRVSASQAGEMVAFPPVDEWEQMEV